MKNAKKIQKEINQKLKKIKEILPLLWNSYKHIYDVRATNIQNNINFLLIVVSFIPLICIALYTYFTYDTHCIFLIPIIFQLFALLVLLKSFSTEKPNIPWLKLEKTLKNLDKDKFESSLFANLKAHEEWTMVYLNEMQKIIKLALFLLLFSLFTTVLAGVFYYFKVGIDFFVLTVLLCFGFYSYIFYYHKRLNFNYDKHYQDHKDKIKKWLKDENRNESVGIVIENSDTTSSNEIVPKINLKE